MLKKLLLAGLFFLPSLAFAERLGSLKNSSEVALSTGAILNTTTPETGKTAAPEWINVESSGTINGPLKVGRKTGAGTGTDGTIRMVQPSVFSTIKIGGEEGQPTISFLRDDETTTEIGHIRADSLSIYTTNPGATAIDYLAGKFMRGGLLVGNDDGIYVGSPKLLVQGNIQSIYGIIAETCTISGLTLSGTFRSTDSITATNNINAGDVIGSQTGNYAFAGTTITFAAPAIDTSDRIPILNNGSVSFPLAITDGARLGSTQTFSGGNEFTSTAGSTFTWINVSSAIVTGLTASQPVLTDANKKLVSGTAGRSLTLNSTAIDADAELYTDSKTLYFESPVATDDFKTIWVAPVAVTITGISCESDQTVNFDLQVDDGSATGVNGSDIACTTFATDSSLAGDTTMAAGDRLDLAVASVSGTPTWVSITFSYTKDD